MARIDGTEERGVLGNGWEKYRFGEDGWRSAGRGAGGNGRPGGKNEPM